MESLGCRAGIHQCQIPPFSFLEMEFHVNSPPVQWLGLFAFTPGGVWVRQGAKILQAAWQNQKKKKKLHFNSVVVGQVDGLLGLLPSSWGRQGPSRDQLPPRAPAPNTGSENHVAHRALGKIRFLSSDLFILFTGEWSGVHLWFLGSHCRNKSPGPPEHAQSAP